MLTEEEKQILTEMNETISTLGKLCSELELALAEHEAEINEGVREADKKDIQIQGEVDKLEKELL